MADQESELEMELEDEFHEGELESEDEAGMEGEGWLGTLGNIAGSLLGEAEDEFEGEFEDETEQFSFGRFLKKALPVLKKVAKVAAPIVGTAIGGPPRWQAWIHGRRRSGRRGI